VAESIFTSQTPSGTFTDGAPGLTLATAFKTDTNGYATHARFYCPTPAPGSSVIGVLYSLTTESSGTELARVTFGSVTPGAWNTAAYASPVALTANVTYVTCWWSSENYVFLAGTLSSAPIVNGHLTAFQTGQPVVNGRFETGASPTFPTGNGNGSIYFADLVFVTELGVTGTGTGVLGALSGTALGRIRVYGTALGSLGTLAGSGAGTVSEHPSHVAIPGWYGLLEIAREAAQLREEDLSAAPVACPRCGEPLRSGPGGVRYCSFDGFRAD
jgi:hypothetical protein